VRVLGISASPRSGNTEALLARLLEGASSQGAAVKMIRLARRDIAPCTHCDACLENGECNIDDDMQELYKELEKADAVVFASPVHFMAVASHAKLFIDRCQALWARKYVLKRPPLGDSNPRKGIFISVGAMKGRHIFDGPRATVKALFASLDIAYAGELLFDGTDGAGEIVNRPGALDEAFKLGAKLAEESSGS
jgi:multimeric flavodoxin WrbA